MKKKTFTKALMYAGIAVGGYLFYKHFFARKTYALPAAKPTPYTHSGGQLYMQQMGPPGPGQTAADMFKPVL